MPQWYLAGTEYRCVRLLPLGNPTVLVAMEGRAGIVLATCVGATTAKEHEGGYVRMISVRVVLANILIACAITIIVVVLALIVPLVVWLQPRRDTQETVDGY